MSKISSGKKQAHLMQGEGREPPPPLWEDWGKMEVVRDPPNPLPILMGIYVLAVGSAGIALVLGAAIPTAIMVAAIATAVVTGGVLLAGAAIGLKKLFRHIKEKRNTPSKRTSAKKIRTVKAPQQTNGLFQGKAGIRHQVKEKFTRKDGKAVKVAPSTSWGGAQPTRF